jgi:hypothetical protein
MHALLCCAVLCCAVLCCAVLCRLPEVFGVDLGAVHPEDPGYNLRPEHIESTWYLAALTGVTEWWLV